MKKLLKVPTFVSATCNYKRCKMKPFKQLSFHDNKVLMSLPVYISLLAANADGIMDEDEKQVAVEFAHIKSFSGNALLKSYYKESENVFKNSLLHVNKQLPKEKASRELAIKKELVHIEKIVMKLDEPHKTILNQDMNALANHISKAHNNVLVNFLFPISITGLLP